MSLLRSPYDDSGNRLTETVNGNTTTFLNDPNQAYDQVLEEYANSGLAATFVRGINIILQDRGGSRSTYVSDNLGSTRALTNTIGATADTVTYDAYGNILLSSGATTKEFLFTGQQFDAAIGQYYLRARYYGQAVGRFTSADSYNGQPARPYTLNHYAYASGDPPDRLDPSGQLDEIELGVTMSEGSAIEIGASEPALTVLQTAQYNLYRLIIAGWKVYTWLPALSVGAWLTSESLQFVDNASRTWATNSTPLPLEGSANFVRGNAAELLINQNLSHNFPGLDDFENGVGTQVKTACYATPEALAARIRSDAWDLSQAGRTRMLVGYAADNVTLVKIQPGEINTRALLVGIPENQGAWLTLASFRTAIQSACNMSRVVIRVVPVRLLRR